MTTEGLTPVQEVRETCVHPVEHVGPALMIAPDGRVYGVTGHCMLCNETCPLTADKAVRCSSVVGNGEPDGAGGEAADECAQPSSFVVARSDGDETYGINGGSDECCGAHLEDTVLGMADGDPEVQVIVAIRWDDSPSADVDRDPDHFRKASARAELNEHGVTVHPYVNLTAGQLEAMAAILRDAPDTTKGEQ